MRRINVRCDVELPTIVIHDHRLWQRRLVYVVRINRKYHYRGGRSRIVYIGETKKGMLRPGRSGLRSAEKAFRRLRGVQEVSVCLVTCRGKQRIKTWEVLEQGLLAVFRDKYRQLPKFNDHGKRFTVNEKYFRRRRLERLIDRLG